MEKLDITIHVLCSTCRTRKPLHYIGERLVTLGEHASMEVRVDPGEFLLCSTCGTPTRLHIQCQPWDPANHLDSPIARHMHRLREQQKGGQENNQ